MEQYLLIGYTVHRLEVLFPNAREGSFRYPIHIVGGTV
jgi:hypothetical protein